MREKKNRAESQFLLGTSNSLQTNIAQNGSKSKELFLLFPLYAILWIMKERSVVISPSILAADFSDIQSALDLISSLGLDYVHLDVMDGNFVPNLTFGFKFIKDMRKHSDLVFDAHLMIENPERYIKEFAAAGCDIITVHKEAARHLNRVINMIREEGKEAGVAINPATSVLEIENVLSIVDYVMVMSVNPGFGGQSFIAESLKKIKALNEIRKREGYEFRIMVDGGVNASNHHAIVEAGADILVIGEAFFKSEDPEKFIEEIES